MSRLSNVTFKNDPQEFALKDGGKVRYWRNSDGDCCFRRFRVDGEPMCMKSFTFEPHAQEEIIPLLKEQVTTKDDTNE